jgi:predicted nucleotidyltransferase
MPNTLIDNHRDALNTLCQHFHVRRLELFGSATRTDFDPRLSDLDFLVDFDKGASSYFDDYFGLLEGLEAMFDRPIDLVSIAAADNPFFLQKIASERELLYAA